MLYSFWTVGICFVQICRFSALYIRQFSSQVVAYGYGHWLTNPEIGIELISQLVVAQK